MGTLGFISFEITDGKCKGFISIDTAITEYANLDIRINKAVRVYENYLKNLRSLMASIEGRRSKKQLVSARQVWQVGNQIFGLKDALAVLSLQLDGVYRHLARDLGVKRKWLEKAIILRRYIPNVNMIPVTLNWGRCEKGTKKAALELVTRYKPN